MARFERKKPLPPPPPAGELAPVRKALGIVGVRKLACWGLQQQLESFKNRVITAEDREFVIEAVKALVAGEKVARQPGKSLDTPGQPLPALEPKS